LQGSINETFFGALDARAVENEDGSFTIQGLTQNQNLTINISGPQAGTYEFGGNSENSAAYVSENNVTYFTNPFGEGQAVITNWDATNKTLSGRFDFTALIPGIDTVNVARGVFYQVPYNFIEIDDPVIEEIEDPATNAGTFAAQIDGESYTPFAVSAVNSDNQITVTGSSAMESISIVVPNSVTAGSYQITNSEFAASYRIGAVTEPAISGQVFIVSHDVSAKIIKGTFSFMTDNYSITIGQFNVIYQDL